MKPVYLQGQGRPTSEHWDLGAVYRENSSETLLITRATLC